ncbi:MAG TPA: hypothetical protein DCQ04_14440 [Actinobacteria bacterium]|nr:hypothetical protein [Actinomycetota bacterium]
MADDEIEHQSPVDNDGVEAWLRLTDESDVRGVDATRVEGDHSWQWTLTVWVLEFIREEPFESQLRRAILDQVRTVPGVLAVRDMDREGWELDGSPSGEELVRTVAQTIDLLLPQIRASLAQPH